MSDETSDMVDEGIPEATNNEPKEEDGIQDVTQDPDDYEDE